LPKLPATFYNPTLETYKGCTAAEVIGKKTPPVYPVPDPQVMPAQERGEARRL
jgi:hypothetical protein